MPAMVTAVIAPFFSADCSWQPACFFFLNLLTGEDAFAVGAMGVVPVNGHAIL
jgi:hypothetical protein